MRSQAKHMIQQVVLDFQFNGKTDGFEFQQEVREWFDEFMTGLGKELDNLSANDRVMSIKTLQLDVELKGSDWKEQASHKITEQMKDKLRMIRSGVLASPGFEEISAGKHFAKAFLFYLEHGYLPWQSSALTTTEWKEQVEELILNADEQFVKQLRNLLFNSGICRERLSQLIPYQTAVELLHSSPDETSLLNQRLIHDLQLLMKIANLHHYSYLKKVVYRAFLLSLSENADILQIKQELSESIHKKSLINPEIIKSLAEVEFQSQRLIKMQNELTANEKTISSKRDARKYRRKKLLMEEEELMKQMEHQAEPFSNPVFINDAGLVILAAFLPALLKRTELCVDSVISDTDKAVCFLHYLATGDTKMEEYELVLSKIICGVSIDKPVNTENFKMSQSLRKEADEVLTSVIEYWAILQNTSVVGLRDSFLKRNGKLSYDGENWLLQVEQRSYDMLLQHLPWNISMIKLPWMNHLLKTEWIY